MTNSFEFETCLLPEETPPDRDPGVGAMFFAAGFR
jgi:hypothetical protein